MKTRAEFVVSVPLVPGLTQNQLAAYIREAVQCWCGQYRPPGAYSADDPGDPLFTEIYQHQGRVRVKRMPRRLTT